MHEKVVSVLVFCQGNAAVYVRVNGTCIKMNEWMNEKGEKKCSFHCLLPKKSWIFLPDLHAILWILYAWHKIDVRNIMINNLFCKCKTMPINALTYFTYIEKDSSDTNTWRVNGNTRSMPYPPASLSNISSVFPLPQVLCISMPPKVHQFASVRSNYLKTANFVIWSSFQRNISKRKIY